MLGCVNVIVLRLTRTESSPEMLELHTTLFKVETPARIELGQTFISGSKTPVMGLLFSNLT